MKRLEEIRERLNNTTSGEWHYNSSSCVLTMGNLKDIELGSFKYRIVAPFVQFSMNKIDNDFEFLANSKKDIEFLLDEVKRFNHIINNYELKSKEEIINEINKKIGEKETNNMLQNKAFENNDQHKAEWLGWKNQQLQAQIEGLRWVLGQK